MANISLTCHPDSPARSVVDLDVAVERAEAGKIWLRFYVDVPVDDLVLAGPAKPERTDGLWRTTCFEAFVRTGEGSGYCEYNFAASSQWAAYQFEDYRAGMAELPMTHPPEIGLDAGDTHFALEAEFNLPEGQGAAPLWLSLTAVIEETDGTKSYWALKHPPGAPDFHHRDCFALLLGAPGAA